MSRATYWPPLCEADPTPGEPDEVSSAGVRYSSMADEIDGQVDRLGTIVSGTLRGGYADSLNISAQRLQAGLALSSARYREVGGVLQQWAPQLTGFQDEAEQLRQAAVTAQSDMSNNRVLPQPSPVIPPVCVALTPAAQVAADKAKVAAADAQVAAATARQGRYDDAFGDLTRAQGRLVELTGSRDAAASRIAGAIREMCDDAVANSAWDSFQDWMNDHRELGGLFGPGAGGLGGLGGLGAQVGQPQAGGGATGAKTDAENFADLDLDELSLDGDMGENVRDNVKVTFSDHHSEIEREAWSKSGGNENFRGEVAAGKVEADADADLHLDANGNLVAAASASAGAYGVYAEGKSYHGNDFANVKGHAKGYVGAEVGVEGQASVGKDGVKLGVGGEAFAGAKGEIEGAAELAGVKMGVGGTVSYGIGAKFDADVQVTMKKVKFSFDAGVTLGIGGGLKFEVDANPQEVAQNVGKAAGAVGSAVASGAGAAANAVGSGVGAVGNAIGSWFD